MVDDVDIKNVGGKYGVASEATMQLILAQLGGSSSSAGSRAQRLADASRDRSTRSTNDNARSQGLLTKGLVAGAGAVGGFVSTLMSTNHRLSDFSKNVLGDSNLFSRSINMLTGYLDDSIDSLRELSSVGASFNNSIFDMQLAAAQGEMSFSDFTSMIKQNSAVLSLLGGTVGKGAEQVALFTKGIRKSDAGKQLMGMGFTIADINEGLVDYLDIQMQSGKKINLRDKTLIAGSAAYLKQIDELARVTGKSRDQISKDLIAQQQDVGIRNQANNLQGQARENFTSTLEIINTKLPALSSGLMDMADGIAQTPLGQIMQSQIQGLGPLMQRQFSGQISDVDFQNELKKLQPEIDKFQKQYGKEIFDAMRSGGGMGAAYAEAADGMNQINAFLNQNLEQLKKEQEQRSKLTELMGTFDQVVESIKTELIEVFLKSAAFNALKMLGVKLLEIVTPGSGTMDSFSDKLAWAADALLGEQGILTKAIQFVSTQVTEFAELVKKGGFLFAFETKLSELSNWISTWFKEIFFGKDDPSRDRQDTTHQKGLFAQAMDGMVSAFESFWEGPYGKYISEKVTGFFKDLVDNIIVEVANATGGLFFFGARQKILGNQQQSENDATTGGQITSKVGEEANYDASMIAKAISELPQLNDNFWGLRAEQTSDLAEALGQEVADAYNKIPGAQVNIKDTLTRLEQKSRGTGGENDLNPAELAFLNAAKAAAKERGIDGFATGTTGFQNFGTVTSTSLHGVEAVVPRNTMAGNMLAKAFGDDWNSPKPVMQSQGGQENTGKYIIQLNSTMLMVLDELRKGTDLEKRTLNSVRSLSGDLNRGI